MGKRSAVREAIRKRLVATPTGSVSATFPEGIVTEVSNIPPDIEEQLVNRIKALITRHKTTVIPAALQAEFEIYQRWLDEVAQVNNEVVDYLQANMYIPSSKLLQALLQLQQLAAKYKARLSKLAAYLQKPLPALPELKPIPGLIIRLGMGWGVRRRFSIR